MFGNNKKLNFSIILIFTFFIIIFIISIINRNEGNNNENGIINITYFHDEKLYSENGFIDEIAFNEKYIAWFDSNKTNILELSNNKKTTIESGFIRDIKMNNNFIIWDKLTYFGNFNIAIYNLSNKTTYYAIKNETVHLGDIYENNIVWSKLIDNKTYRNIFIYNISTKEETRITHPNLDQFTPSIYNKKVVWYGGKFNLDSQGNILNSEDKILLYDIDTKKINIIKNLSTGSVPKIFGENIIWSDIVDGKTCIQLLNLQDNTIKNISMDYNNINDYEIYGDNIVWSDNRSGDYDIYMYDISEGKTYNLTPTKGDQQKPKIFKNKVIWIQTSNKKIEKNGFMIKPESIHLMDLSIDSDNDTIPDYKDEDDDNDGFSDLEEIDKGTDPLDKESHPKEEKDYLLYLIPISSIIAICAVIIIFKKYRKTKQKTKDGEQK